MNGILLSWTIPPPSGDGEPPWSNDPHERSASDPNYDEFGDYTQSQYKLSVFWMTLHPP